MRTERRIARRLAGPVRRLALRAVSLLANILLVVDVLQAYDTAGSMLHVDQSRFNHSHLTQLTWKAEISEYDYIPAGSGPFRIRIEFNSVGFGGSAGIHYVGAMIQNVGHAFTDDATGNAGPFPALGLYLTSLRPEWADSFHGVELNADPTSPPRFGRIFENVDVLGYSAKNIYTRQNVGQTPLVIRWTVTKVGTVTNPQRNLSKNLAGDWVPLVGTFVVWNFTIEVNGVSYNVADYYLPVQYAEYILGGDPLVLHQEYFGAASRALDGQKGSVRYTDMRAFDGTRWYYLSDWNLTWRIDDGAGNRDNRFGWKTDGSSLTSRVGHEEDAAECGRDPGSSFRITRPCVTTDGILCLQDGRFSVTADWMTGDGDSGQGKAFSLTSDTGYFWFFSSNNVEMVVKVVDGRAFNSRFWVFAGGLTNVNAVLTVIDTETNAVKTYTNPQGVAFQPIQDTNAFASSVTLEPSKIAPAAVSATQAVAAKRSVRPAASEPFFAQTISAHAPCASDATTLCLNTGRFTVRTRWTTPQGESGAGQAIALTSDTGYFWFFSSNNVEIVVKAVTGCPLNSRYWVFAGGLTNVHVEMTVIDSQTDEVKVYTNPQSTAFQPIQDTSAFVCP